MVNALHLKERKKFEVKILFDVFFEHCFPFVGVFFFGG